MGGCRLPTYPPTRLHTLRSKPPLQGSAAPHTQASFRGTPLRDMSPPETPYGFRVPLRGPGMTPVCGGGEAKKR